MRANKSVNRWGLVLVLVVVALSLLGCGKKDKIYTCADEFGDVKNYCAETGDEALQSCLRDPFMGNVCSCSPTGLEC